MMSDWFTVVAQVLNFLILVWLMKRFLYKPIRNAIDAREKKISLELADAALKVAEAKKERDEFHRKNDEFEQHRAALLNQANDEAEMERQRLLDGVRKEADALSVTRQEALRRDAHALKKEISRRTQDEVFAIARKALTDLATTSLEERLADVFTRRLRKMDGKEKERFAEALKTASEPAVVRSAFALPGTQRAAIQHALNEVFATEIRVRFEAAPEVVGGIELTTNGQKIGWSIAKYLTTLEQDISKLLKETDTPANSPVPLPEAPKPEAKSQ